MSAIAIQQKKKADQLMEQAELELTKKSWFSSREKHYEAACELFQSAGNAYKVGGYYYEAGQAYDKAGTLLRDSLSNLFEASKAFQNAGSNYKKADPVKAMEAFQAAILLMTDAGRVLQAAKLSKECAELYEQEEDSSTDERSHIVLAIETYQQAAELFSAEDANSQSSQCWAKVAELCSVGLVPPDWSRAAQLYETLGRKCLDSNLLKFNAKGYFMQSILCHLANQDGVAAKHARDRFESLDYTFGSSREGKFALELMEAAQGMDVEAFATACFEYDRISKLDPWKTSVLVQIKRTIDDDDGSGGHDEDDDVDLT